MQSTFKLVNSKSKQSKYIPPFFYSLTQTEFCIDKLTQAPTRVATVPFMDDDSSYMHTSNLQVFKNKNILIVHFCVTDKTRSVFVRIEYGQQVKVFREKVDVFTSCYNAVSVSDGLLDVGGKWFHVGWDSGRLSLLEPMKKAWFDSVGSISCISIVDIDNNINSININSVCFCICDGWLSILQGCHVKQLKQIRGAKSLQCKNMQGSLVIYVSSSDGITSYIMNGEKIEEYSRLPLVGVDRFSVGEKSILIVNDDGYICVVDLDGKNATRVEVGGREGYERLGIEYYENMNENNLNNEMKEMKFNLNQNQNNNLNQNLNHDQLVHSTIISIAINNISNQNTSLNNLNLVWSDAKNLFDSTVKTLQEQETLQEITENALVYSQGISTITPIPVQEHYDSILSAIRTFEYYDSHNLPKNVGYFMSGLNHVKSNPLKAYLLFKKVDVCDEFILRLMSDLGSDFNSFCMKRLGFEGHFLYGAKIGMEGIVNENMNINHNNSNNKNNSILLMEYLLEAGLISDAMTIYKSLSDPCHYKSIVTCLLNQKKFTELVTLDLPETVVSFLEFKAKQDSSIYGILFAWFLYRDDLHGCMEVIKKWKNNANSCYGLTVVQMKALLLLVEKTGCVLIGGKSDTLMLDLGFVECINGDEILNEIENNDENEDNHINEIQNNIKISNAIIQCFKLGHVHRSLQMAIKYKSYSLVSTLSDYAINERQIVTIDGPTIDGWKWLMKLSEHEQIGSCIAKCLVERKVTLPVWLKVNPSDLIRIYLKFGQIKDAVDVFVRAETVDWGLGDLLMGSEYKESVIARMKQEE